MLTPSLTAHGSAVAAVPPARYGVASINEPIALEVSQFNLIANGIRELWSRIEASANGPVDHPLLLSYDVHLSESGPKLIEVNTNAGGVLAAFDSARWVNTSCADEEQQILRGRLLELLRRDLVQTGERLAIIDENLSSQPLLPEMQALAQMLRDEGVGVDVLDASQLLWLDGRLRYSGSVIDAIYWRCTDFELEHPDNAAIRRAVEAGAVRLAPSPSAWRAIADKRRFVDWSRQPVLATDPKHSQSFSIARTVTMESQANEDWYRDRAD